MKNTTLNILLLAVVMISNIPANAQGPEKGAKAKPTNAAPAEDDKKVDISDLENKYWAPKDTDFSVVQNRTYPKEGKIFISPQYGLIVNDQYNEGSVMGISGQYFFSERYGVQIESFKSDLKLNKAMQDLSTLASGAQADHGKLTGYYGVGFNMVPFYAKMSVLGKKIIYFDMAFTPVIGMSTYDQVVSTGNVSKTALTYGFDISQYFLFNKWVAIRTDLKSHWRSEEVLTYGNGSTTGGVKVKDKTTYDTLFTMGLMFFW